MVKKKNGPFGVRSVFRYNRQKQKREGKQQRAHFFGTIFAPYLTNILVVLSLYQPQRSNIMHHGIKGDIVNITLARGIGKQTNPDGSTRFYQDWDSGKVLERVTLDLYGLYGQGPILACAENGKVTIWNGEVVGSWEFAS